jgi:hypothetical protein
MEAQCYITRCPTPWCRTFPRAAFSQWLRDEKQIDPTTFPTYEHRYEDGRVVRARLYPNSLLAEFRAHFDGVWLPTRCRDYFADRDPKALPFLPALLSEPKKKLAS